MASESDSPPSSLLGPLQDEILSCGGCGQCFECRIDDSDSSSGNEQMFPFTCYTCNKHFANEVSYNLHISEHPDEKIFDCLYCDEAFATVEALNRHKKSEHSVADTKDTGTREQQLTNVEEDSVQLGNNEPALVYNKRLIRCKFCHEIFTSNALLIQHVCNYINSSTDTDDSMETNTSAIQMQLESSDNSLALKAAFKEHEESKKKAESSQRTLLDQSSQWDSDVPNIAILSVNSSDDYEADASSMSADTSHSSTDETKSSPFTFQLTEAPRIYPREGDTKCRDKDKRKKSKQIVPHGISFTESLVSPKSGTSNKPNEPQCRSKLITLTTPTSKEVDEPSTSRDKCYFQLSSGKGNKCQPPPLFLAPSSRTEKGIHQTCTPSNSGEARDNSSLPSTSSDNPNYRLISGEANKRQRPWFRVPSCPIGEGICLTQQPPNSADDKNDVHSSREANKIRLCSLLELSPTSILKMSRTNQPSTSNCERAYQLSKGRSRKRRPSPTIESISKFDLERSYETDPSSTSSGDHDYCLPSREATKDQPHSRVAVPLTLGGEESTEVDHVSTDNVGLDSSCEANENQLHSTFVVPSSSYLNLTLNIDQPSTSKGYRGYVFPFGGKSDNQPSPMIVTASTSNTERTYGIDKPSTSSGDSDNRISSPKGDYHDEKKVSAPLFKTIDRNLHTGESDKKFICEECEREYATKHLLKEHKCHHTISTRPINDEYWYQYNSESILKSRYVCRSDKLKCRFCRKPFANMRNVKRHEEKYHSKNLEAKSKKDK